MNGWEKDKLRTDKYLSTVKAILGQCLIGEASREEDQERNTDLIVLTMNAVRIACRLRDRSYMLKYGDEFTIRYRRPGGAKTEYAKIVEGWGDYVFYGFMADTPPDLLRWFVGDLNVLRNVIAQGKQIGKVTPNKDGSSDFLPVELQRMPEEFIVMKSWKTVSNAVEPDEQLEWFQRLEAGGGVKMSTGEKLK